MAYMNISSSSGMTPCCREPGDAPLEVFTKMSELGVPASGSKMSARVGEIGDRVRLN
jgi:hypothetical protein